MRHMHDMHVFVPMASSGLSLTWGAKCSIYRHQGECSYPRRSHSI